MEKQRPQQVACKYLLGVFNCLSFLLTCHVYFKSQMERRDVVPSCFFDLLQILYKLEYNKARPRGYTTIHDTPMLLHVRKVKDEVSDVSNLR